MPRHVSRHTSSDPPPPHHGGTAGKGDTGDTSATHPSTPTIALTRPAQAPPPLPFPPMGKLHIMCITYWPKWMGYPQNRNGLDLIKVVPPHHQKWSASWIGNESPLAKLPTR